MKFEKFFMKGMWFSYCQVQTQLTRLPRRTSSQSRRTASYGQQTSDMLSPARMSALCLRFCVWKKQHQKCNQTIEGWAGQGVEPCQPPWRPVWVWVCTSVCGWVCTHAWWVHDQQCPWMSVLWKISFTVDWAAPFEYESVPESHFPLSHLLRLRQSIPFQICVSVENETVEPESPLVFDASLYSVPDTYNVLVMGWFVSPPKYLCWSPNL